MLPGVNFLYGWDINDFFSVGASTQANRAIDDNGEDFYVEFAQSITTGYGWTEKFGSYAEWYMFAPAGAETSQNQQYFNARRHVPDHGQPPVGHPRRRRAERSGRRLLHRLGLLVPDVLEAVSIL